MLTIDRSKVVAAAKALDYHPDDVLSLHIDSGHVTVVLAERDEDGSRCILDGKLVKRAEILEVVR